MSEESERANPQMKTAEEIQEVLDLLEAAPKEPDRISNAERRRTLLWVLGREDEAKEIEYEDGVLPRAFR